MGFIRELKQPTMTMAKETSLQNINPCYFSDYVNLYKVTKFFRN